MKTKNKRKSLIKKGWLSKQLWLILMITVYAVLLVGNRYNVEQLLRQRNKMQEEISNLKEETMRRQKEYQQSVKITRIAQELDSSGVQFISGPPYEIERN